MRTRSLKRIILITCMFSFFMSSCFQSLVCAGLIEKQPLSKTEMNMLYDSDDPSTYEITAGEGGGMTAGVFVVATVALLVAWLFVWDNDDKNDAIDRLAEE